MNCGHCHTCGGRLRSVLDGEEWCVSCETYRRYSYHGWSRGEGPACPSPEALHKMESESGIDSIEAADLLPAGAEGEEGRDE